MARPHPQRARQVPHLLSRTRHPRRARACLVTDHDVTDTATRHAAIRPQPDEVSHGAIPPASGPPANWSESGIDANEENQQRREEPTGSDMADATETLWLAMCTAPDDGIGIGIGMGIGIGIGELMRITGMSRPTLYRRRAEHAKRAYMLHLAKRAVSARRAR